MIITTYIDESGTHGGPTQTMGCLVGNDKQWEAFDEGWRTLLKNSNLTYYHSKKLKHSNGEFKGWTDENKFAFLSKAAVLTEAHTMFGVTAVLGYQDYTNHYVASQRPREIQLDSKYGLSFRFCVLRTLEILRYSLGDPDNLGLYFVLESGHKNFGDAVRIFDLLKEKGPPDIARFLRTVTAGDKKEFPGLQGADGGAYNMLASEIKRTDPPGTIRIPSPDKTAMASPSQWMHYNFIISPEKMVEFKSNIMNEVNDKRSRRRTTK